VSGRRSTLSLTKARFGSASVGNGDRRTRSLMLRNPTGLVGAETKAYPVAQSPCLPLSSIANSVRTSLAQTKRTGSGQEGLGDGREDGHETFPEASLPHRPFVRRVKYKLRLLHEHGQVNARRRDRATTTNSPPHGRRACSRRAQRGGAGGCVGSPATRRSPGPRPASASSCRRLWCSAAAEIPRSVASVGIDVSLLGRAAPLQRGLRPVEWIRTAYPQPTWSSSRHILTT